MYRSQAGTVKNNDSVHDNPTEAFAEYTKVTSRSEIPTNLICSSMSRIFCSNFS